MNDLDSTLPAVHNPEAAPAQAGKHPLYAIVDVAVWLWPRRRLLVAELRAAHRRQRAPRSRKRPSQRLRFAV